MKKWIDSKVDLIKTALFNLFAPNLCKLLYTRYTELRDRMDALDEEYSEDISAAHDEIKNLTSENLSLRSDNVVLTKDNEYLHSVLTQTVKELSALTAEYTGNAVHTEEASADC